MFYLCVYVYEAVKQISLSTLHYRSW